MTRSVLGCCFPYLSGSSSLGWIPFALVKGLSFGQDGPDGARHFVGQRGNHYIEMPALQGERGKPGAEQYAAHFVTDLLNCGGHGNDQVRRRNLSASRLDSSNQPDDLAPPSGAQRQLDC